MTSSDKEQTTLIELFKPLLVNTSLSEYFLNSLSLEVKTRNLNDLKCLIFTFSQILGPMNSIQKEISDHFNRIIPGRSLQSLIYQDHVPLLYELISTIYDLADDELRSYLINLLQNIFYCPTSPHVESLVDWLVKQLLKPTEFIHLHQNILTYIDLILKKSNHVTEFLVQTLNLVLIQNRIETVSFSLGLLQTISLSHLELLIECSTVHFILECLTETQKNYNYCENNLKIQIEAWNCLESISKAGHKFFESASPFLNDILVLLKFAFNSNQNDCLELEIASLKFANSLFSISECCKLVDLEQFTFWIKLVMKNSQKQFEVRPIVLSIFSSLIELISITDTEEIFSILTESFSIYEMQINDLFSFSKLMEPLSRKKLNLASQCIDELILPYFFQNYVQNKIQNNGLQFCLNCLVEFFSTCSKTSIPIEFWFEKLIGNFKFFDILFELNNTTFYVTEPIQSKIKQLFFVCLVCLDKDSSCNFRHHLEWFESFKKQITFDLNNLGKILTLKIPKLIETPKSLTKNREILITAIDLLFWSCFYQNYSFIANSCQNNIVYYLSDFILQADLYTYDLRFITRLIYIWSICTDKRENFKINQILIEIFSSFSENLLPSLFIFEKPLESLICWVWNNHYLGLEKISFEIIQNFISFQNFKNQNLIADMISSHSSVINIIINSMNPKFKSPISLVQSFEGLKFVIKKCSKKNIDLLFMAMIAAPFPLIILKNYKSSQFDLQLLKIHVFINTKLLLHEIEIIQNLLAEKANYSSIFAKYSICFHFWCTMIENLLNYKSLLDEKFTKFKISIINFLNILLYLKPCEDEVKNLFNPVSTNFLFKNSNSLNSIKAASSLTLYLISIYVGKNNAVNPLGISKMLRSGCSVICLCGILFVEGKTFFEIENNDEKTLLLKMFCSLFLDVMIGNDAILSQISCWKLNQICSNANLDVLYFMLHLPHHINLLNSFDFQKPISKIYLLYILTLYASCARISSSLVPFNIKNLILNPILIDQLLNQLVIESSIDIKSIIILCFYHMNFSGMIKKFPSTITGTSMLTILNRISKDLNFHHKNNFKHVYVDGVLIFENLFLPKFQANLESNFLQRLEILSKWCLQQQ